MLIVEIRQSVMFVKSIWLTLKKNVEGFAHRVSKVIVVSLMVSLKSSRHFSHNLQRMEGHVDSNVLYKVNIVYNFKDFSCQLFDSLLDLLAILKCNWKYLNQFQHFFISLDVRFSFFFQEKISDFGKIRKNLFTLDSASLDWWNILINEALYKAF